MTAKFLKVFLLVPVLTLWFAASFSYADNKEDLDRRIWNANQVMGDIMQSPDQAIPEELLAKCKAIAIYPSVIKGGFILGAKFGKGVVLTKGDDGKWGPVAFSTIGGGSWGLQVGAQSIDLILLVMNDRGIDGLLSNNFSLGADASIAAGPVGRDASGRTDLSLTAGILSYSRSRGLFGGVSLEGAILTEDDGSNHVYYGKPVTSKDILLNHAVSIHESSQELVSSLNDYSSRWGKQ